MLQDIKKLWFVTLFVFQAIFIAFYAYSIYSNIGRLVFLIAYSILLALSLISFITFLIRHRQHRKQNKKFSRAKNFLKYATNFIMIIVNIIQMIKYGVDTYSKVLLIISAISLSVQIIIEIVKMFAERYIEDLKYAFEKDFELLDLSKWKSNGLKLINAPLEKIANIKKGKEKEMSKEDERIERHIQKYKDRIEEHKEQRSIERQAEKEEKKQQENLRVKQQLAELKSNIKELFTRNKKETSNKKVDSK